MANPKRVQAERTKYWQEWVAHHQQSGKSVRVFCREHNLGEHSFYMWRQRLRRQDPPVRFALVEAAGLREQDMGEPLELVLLSGDRLLINRGVDPATLRMVLAVLRESRA